MHESEESPYDPLDWEHVRDVGRVRVELFRVGARVHFTPRSEPEEITRGDSATIKDQSTPSRHRAAFCFGNAECDWIAMSVLTWREAPAGREVKRVLRYFRDRWRDRWGEPICGWLLEMQARGVPHFHLFHSSQSNFGTAIRASAREVVTRKGRRVELVRGGPDYWMRDAWQSAIDDWSDATTRFNAGGIIEILLSPDAAGRYVAKECSKREQKRLPDRYQEGLGRWWRLNPKFSPQPRAVAEVDLATWPWFHPMAHIWNAGELTLCEDSLKLATLQTVLSTGEKRWQLPYE